MITVKLSNPLEFPATIRDFREDVCRCSGVIPQLEFTSFLPYASYLFAFCDDDPKPAGMLEFFFVSERCSDPEDATAEFLRKVLLIGPLKDLVHVGTLGIREDKRCSRVLTALCDSFVDLASRQGGRVMTVGSAAVNRRSSKLQSRLGLRRLGSFVANGAIVELSYLTLAAARERTRIWKSHRPVLNAFHSRKEIDYE